MFIEEKYRKLMILAMIIVLVFVLFAVFLSFSNSFRFSGKDSKLGGSFEQEETDQDIELIAVGDVMLARTVEQKMIYKNDWSYPFLKTKDFLSGADITFGNLETTILEGETTKEGSFFFRTDPRTVEGLVTAGFDVLSIANNHIINFGENGLVSTIENLDSVDIEHVGAGVGGDIDSPVILQVKGKSFGFLAYSYSNEKFVDGDGETYGVSYMDADNMKKQVEDLKSRVDFVIVSMHSGVEYETIPNGFQKSFARDAIDSGADVVLGHHPHVVQTVEKYEGGYIIYSLGNFVFDQMWSEETRLGVIAKITFSGDSISDIEFFPVKIFEYSQPRFAEEEDEKKILSRLSLD